MSKINTYIVKVVSKQLFSTLFILVGMIWLLKTISFLDILINKNASVADFLHISVLVLPDMLVVLIPLAMFAGAYAGLKKMVTDSEMDAIYAAGISRAKVMLPLLFVATIAVGATYFDSLYVIPKSRQSFYDLKDKLAQDSSLLAIEPGTFNSVSENITVYVQEIEENSWLKNIIVFDKTNQESPVTWTAEEGMVRLNANNKPSLALFNGTRQEVSVNGQTSVLEFRSHQIDLTPKVETASQTIRKKKASEMYLPELFAERLIGTEKQRNKTKAVIYKRLFWPLASFAMALIPLYYLFKPVKRRFGIGRPSVYAIIMALGFVVLQLFFNSQVTSGKDLFAGLSIALEVVPPLLIIFVLLRENAK